MNERDENLLNFIKEEAELLLEVTEEYDLQRFLDSKLMQHAVSMVLIHIGESVKLLSKELKEENNIIKWRFIAGLRDIAAHGYRTLYMDDIWGVVTEDVPDLLEKVKDILLVEEVERG
ncbi:MAG: DUF86 domain-containing protein [Methanomicrobiales archaeon]|jgi:uncharacterized protein with HEPN domain|nr:DUF86 domain-containing protein [Methanomicrobiales archaeon]